MSSHPPYDETAKVVRAAIAGKEQPPPTVTDLAGKLGIPRGRLGSRLAGRTDFKVSELKALADALDVPVSALIDGPAVPATRGRME